MMDTMMELPIFLTAQGLATIVIDMLMVIPGLSNIMTFIVTQYGVMDIVVLDVYQ